METYKHFSTISSQVYFCACPIRLDSVNRCQYGCTYCFSRNRSLDTSTPGMRGASPPAFEKRLRRISHGIVQSAFDEFLAARVPIQLGGLQDPFSPIELRLRVAQQLLEILREHSYPTIISTKGTIITGEPYLSLLRSMNVLVRFSSAGVKDECKANLELGCPSFPETLDSIRRLSSVGVPVSLRIQPVIPGHEEAALRMVELAASAGVAHVSFEYLKLGSEERSDTIKRVSNAIGADIWEEMSSRGMYRVGRDYTLKPSAKVSFLRKARKVCRQAVVKFGAGDTEFIHTSDGTGCCNGSSLFLKGDKQFRANFVGVLSGRGKGTQIRFQDLAKEWQPRRDVHGYLTTDSRGRDLSGKYSSWMSLVAHRWNGGRSPYSPKFFWGVDWTGDIDSSGFKIYRIDEEL